MNSLEYVRVAEALMASSDDSNWRQWVRHVMPTLIPDGELSTLPDDGLPERVCGRAKTDVLKLASAFSVMITPRGVNWFRYESSKLAEDVADDERDWFMKVSQITQKELECSNFYSQLLGEITDHVAAGTGLMLAEEDERTRGLVFTHVPVGTFRLAENKYHEVDTVVRKFKFTAHQAVQAWGEDALDNEMLTAYRTDAERFKKQFVIWHLVMPRNVADRGNGAGLKDPLRMSWASVYIAEGTKKVLHEGGYHEFPYLCTRFLKTGNQVYGDSALAGIQQEIEDYLEVKEATKESVKLAAFPRVLATPEMANELDMRAGGITLMSREAVGQGLPREWATTGTQSNAGMLALEDYKNEIDAGLFVDQLQTVSNVERQMTAREVVARENEKLMTFSQTFTQFTADFRPLMERVFCLLFRAGKFPKKGAPRDLFVPVGADGKGVRILAPGVKYLGKLSKALESAKQSGLVESLSFAMEMFGVTQDPAWLDYFKPYECIKFITDESNVDVGCVRDTAEAKEQAELRRKAAEAEQAAAMQQQLAAAELHGAQAAAVRERR